jgi:hypothetical protein
VSVIGGRVMVSVIGRGGHGGREGYEKEGCVIGVSK